MGTRGAGSALAGRAGARGIGTVARYCVALALCMLGGALLGAAVRGHGAHAQPSGRLDGTRYGPDAAKVQAAVAAAGQQTRNNYCGVATISAIATFAGGSAGQATVAAYLDSDAARSAWGTAWGGTDWGFAADISKDLGTDPRSLAQGLTRFAGTQYRQVIGLNGADSATAHLVDDLVTGGTPISVIVDHGQHSVLVTGVYAHADPRGNLGSVTGMDVWDPGAGTSFGGIQSAKLTTISLNTWLYDGHYWGSPYNANYAPWLGTYLDPDPIVGPYDVRQNPRARLWIDHYVYFRQSGAATPDWGFTDDGALILGLHGERPPGYGGATVPMPVIPPPPPTATNTPQPTATPVPTATPLPTATPVPTPVPTAISLPTVAPTGKGPLGAWRGVCQLIACPAVLAVPWWMYGIAVALIALLIVATVLLLRAVRRVALRRRAARAKAALEATVRERE